MDNDIKIINTNKSFTPIKKESNKINIVKYPFNFQRNNKDKDKDNENINNLKRYIIPDNKSNNFFDVKVINTINNINNNNEIITTLNTLYYSFNNKIKYTIHNNIKCDIYINSFEQLKNLNDVFLINIIENLNNLYSLEIQTNSILNKIHKIILSDINDIVLFQYKVNNLLSNNFLKYLTFNNMNNLKYIDIDNTKLKYLTINNCNLLNVINISNNNIKYLLINNCPNLKKINCSNNQLKDIQFINCNNINYIDCSNNLLCSKKDSLKIFDISKFNKLKYFNALNNYILYININQDIYNNIYKEFYYDEFTKINLCKLH